MPTFEAAYGEDYYSNSRTRLLDRNRILAALSAGTVVVEAGRMSGSMHTARDAAGLGQPLMAVSGPATPATSGGCRQLILHGDAVLVVCGADVIEAPPKAHRSTRVSVFPRVLEPQAY